MRNFEKELKNKEINETALLKYGFTKVQNGYIYHTTICNGQFEMIVEVQGNQMTSKLIDCASEEEYILADIEDSAGEFVGKVVFPGYHMNKKSWITIILDGAMKTKRICELIDNSYALSSAKK